MDNYITVGEGRYKIELTVTATQDGFIAHLMGGEKHHVGGVVTSVPRPKKNGEGMTIDTWITPVPGHKDTEVAKPVAEMICRGTNQVVVVVAGVHIKNAKKDEIDLLVANCLEAAQKIKFK